MNNANTLSRAADPEVRASGLGGSDISVVAGLNPFKSPYELWLEKRGQLPEVIAADQREREMRLLFGHLFEEPVAQGYCILRSKREKQEIKVARKHETLRHPKNSWAMAHIDRRVVGERRGLECKNVGPWAWRESWGPDGSDQVPDYMLLQCQWYIAVTGYELWDLAALHGGNDLRIYTIPRDQGIIDSLISMGEEFWEHVESGTTPEITWASPATTELFKRLYPGSDGSMREASAELFKWHEVRQEAIQRRGYYDEVAEGATNHLKLEMGNASKLMFADGSGYTRKLITRKAYEVPENSFIDFRFTKQMKADK